MQLFNMVGMRFSRTEHIVKRLRAGERLWLRREPENGHDPHAIAVYDETKTRRLAYLKSAPDQQQLARSMDMTGRHELAVRYAVTPERWPQVEVDI